MKEVWKEICKSIPIKVTILTFSSIIFLFLLAVVLSRSLNEKKTQLESNINTLAPKSIATNVTE